ncbi:MAG: ExbD/TolR family protein [Planctomycetota bacterium]
MADDAHAPIKMDMTPMIDVVFQLIIFFMLVTDMSQQDLAELKLPLGTEAVKDETKAGRITVNIHKDGTVEIKRDHKTSGLENADTQNWVRTYLANEVAKADKEEDGNSTRSILVRADRDTEFKHVQKLMRICGENGIRIYQLDLAAAQNEQP